MRRLGLAFLSTSALMGFGHTAWAADVPARTPVYKAAPAMASVYNWTGFYAGGNIGYSWGRAKSDFGFPESTIDIGGIPTPGNPLVPGFAVSDSVKLKGVIGGGQLGYNWQTAPNWVFGFETDFQGSGEKGSRTRSDPFTLTLAFGEAGCAEVGFPPCTLTGLSTTDYTARIKWFGTARGRVGYAWDRVLFYGTGGLAYGRVKLDGAINTSVTVTDSEGNVLGTGTDVLSLANSKIKTGWTLGAGIEGVAWDPRWTWKVEYLYMDLGKLQVSALSSAGDPLVIDTKFTDNIVRFGLNYRFGDLGKAPLVARY